MNRKERAALAAANTAADGAFAHLGMLIAAENTLRRLDTGALNSAGLAIVALFHAQQMDPATAGPDVHTPLETLTDVAPLLSDRARDVVGSIACALVNMQGEITRRGPSGVASQLKRGLIDSKKKKGRGGIRNSKKTRRSGRTAAH